MSELGFDGGEVMRRGRPAWVGHVRRPLLVLAVAVLCAAAYLAGIWTGMSTHVTCTATGSGQIVCGDGVRPAPTPPGSPRTTA
jgi:hypothetical protein